MATIKQLLEKATLKVSAHSDLPSTSGVSLGSLLTNAYNEYTPPADGWIFMSATMPNGNSSGFFANRPTAFNGFIAGQRALAGFMTHYFKVYRGVKCMFKVDATDASVALSATFYKSLGGVKSFVINYLSGGRDYAFA